ncbi:flagellin [Fodinicurvata sp. EGI_FJ10296]|uniref:flagellin n=1 Tax=Fodinicurvata sp. EGI_FJ10296 TaxID=3231908 RepID=UPI003453D637
MSNSILTNVGAQAALQNLRSVGKNIGQVQERISTGLKVGNAKDNASAFSVAQTMRADIASFKSIGEGLSVSQSTVSVARSSAEQVSDVIKEIRTLITDAENPAVSNDKVQADIDQRISQIESIVGGAQFNGVNLLTDSGTERLLSSIDRAGENVSASYINANRSDLRINGGLGMLDNMRVADSRGAEIVDRAPSSEAQDERVVIDLGGLDGSSAGDLEISIGGTATTYTVAAGDTAEDVLQGLASALGGSVDSASVQNGRIVVEDAAALEVSNLSTPASFTGGASFDYQNLALAADETGALLRTGEAPDDGSVVRFSANGNDYRISIDSAGTASTFQEDSGVFEAAASNMTDVIDAIDSVTGLTGTAASADSSGLLRIVADQDTTLSNVTFKTGTGDDFQTLLGRVESALQTATGAAAEFGSVQQRLELQQDFVTNLTDALDAGVGALVDADMAEESARLQALQVQQQLSTQALSIANSQPQNILSLFR